MVKRKFILSQEQIRDFCKMGWKHRVVSVRGDIILPEAGGSEEEMSKRSPKVMEDLIKEPGEC